jgi:excisionase family DNA binding protein
MASARLNSIFLKEATTVSNITNKSNNHIISKVMQTDLTAEGITFNDLPAAMSKMLNKVERLEVTLSSLREDIRKSTNKSTPSDHIPMSTDEVSQFLGKSKQTIYYYVQNGLIPYVRRGKNCLFFKDEILEWMERGRESVVPPTIEEINAALGKRPKRTPPHK